MLPVLKLVVGSQRIKKKIITKYINMIREREGERGRERERKKKNTRLFKGISKPA